MATAPPPPPPPPPRSTPHGRALAARAVVTYELAPRDDCPWRLVTAALSRFGAIDALAYRRACSGARWSRAVRAFNAAAAAAAGRPLPPDRVEALVPLVHHPRGPRLRYIREVPGEMADIVDVPAAAAESHDAAIAELRRFPPDEHTTAVMLAGGNPGAVAVEYLTLADVRRALPRVLVAVLGAGPADCGRWRHPVKTVHDWVVLLAPPRSGRANAYRLVLQDGAPARPLCSAAWRAKPWRVRLPPPVTAAATAAAAADEEDEDGETVAPPAGEA